ENLDFMSKSVFDMRINNMHSGILSGVKLSGKAGTYVLRGPEKDEARYVSVSAKNLADMRFIANAIRDMGLDKKKASKFIQVRVADENIDENITEENLEKYMEATGLGLYLKRKNVVIVSSEEEKTMTLAGTLKKVSDSFGTGIEAHQIAVGDTFALAQADITLLESEKAPVYVQMAEGGVASQLLLTVLEVVANDGRIPGDLGSVIAKEGHSRWYIYMPNCGKVDPEKLKAEIKNYEAVLMAV
ncbi:MAG: hypothetical protein KJ995_06390, partial [Candidatus Omnitrophica bacterium]|nr:hypothetical protein [Candidatus Omnitrophota bacterium]MBU1128721.1 hypothetical protein [Candidatus Omnitrophota bacterium]MBU1852011.1 hypothetical protein [Candidatus Omnitrophota bacterium]